MTFLLWVIEAIKEKKYTDPLVSCRQGRLSLSSATLRIAFKDGFSTLFVRCLYTSGLKNVHRGHSCSNNNCHHLHCVQVCVPQERDTKKCRHCDRSNDISNQISGRYCRWSLGCHTKLCYLQWLRWSVRWRPPLTVHFECSKVKSYCVVSCQQINGSIEQWKSDDHSTTEWFVSDDKKQFHWKWWVDS